MEGKTREELDAIAFRWRPAPHRRARGPNTHLAIEGPDITALGLAFGVDETRCATVCACAGSLLWACQIRLGAFNGEPDPGDKCALRQYVKSLRTIYSRMTCGGKLRRVSTLQIANGYSGKKRLDALVDRVLLAEQGLGERMVFRAECKGHELNEKLTNVRSRAILPQKAFYPEGVRGGVFAGQGKGWRLSPILAENAAGRYDQERRMHNLRNPDNTPVFNCGLTQEQVARLIVYHSNLAEAAAQLDLESMDGFSFHTAPLERRVFVEYTEDPNDPVLSELMRTQNQGNIDTPELKLRIKGIRQSGTAGTAVANKCVMYAMLHSHFGDGAYYLIFGDDALVWVRGDSSAWMTDLPVRYKRVGYNLKVDGISCGPSAIVACRSQVVVGKRGWVMAKTPASAFRKVFNISRHLRGSEFDHYVHTIGVGYSKLWEGVPVLEELGLCLASVVGKVKPDLLSNSGMEYLMRHVVPKVNGEAVEHSYVPTIRVTPEPREAFCDAFGILPAQQISMEAQIRAIAVSGRGLQGRIEDAMRVVLTVGVSI